MGLGFVVLVGCVGGEETLGDGDPGDDGCEVVACYTGDRVFCGAPEVRLGQGASEFLELDGDTMPVTFGSGNGRRKRLDRHMMS